VLSHVYKKPVEAFAGNMTKLTPELASTAAIYLSHESCQLNGAILVCGGGQVLRMAIMQNQGFTDPDMTVESIASHIDQIMDMSHATNVGVGAGGKASMPHTKEPLGAH